MMTDVDKHADSHSNSNLLNEPDARSKFIVETCVERY